MYALANLTPAQVTALQKFKPPQDALMKAFGSQAAINSDFIPFSECYKELVTVSQNFKVENDISILLDKELYAKLQKYGFYSDAKPIPNNILVVQPKIISEAAPSAAPTAKQTLSTQLELVKRALKYATSSDKQTLDIQQQLITKALKYA
jgi:hypothetical protein